MTAYYDLEMPDALGVQDLLETIEAICRQQIGLQLFWESSSALLADLCGPQGGGEMQIPAAIWTFLPGVPPTLCENIPYASGGAWGAMGTLYLRERPIRLRVPGTHAAPPLAVSTHRSRRAMLARGDAIQQLQLGPSQPALKRREDTGDAMEVEVSNKRKRRD